MTMIRKTMPLQSEDVAGNRTRVIASTNELARDGHIVEPSGLSTENFLRTGVILFDHDPKMPIASPVAAVNSPDGRSLSVELEWPPAGISADSDKIRGLVKAGVIRAVSIGFEPGDMEPLDKQRPRGGQHITTAELLELSFVSVPADTGAVVTQRSDSDWKCGVSRDLPLEDSDEWDGSAAENSIFEWAGGTDFDPSKARKGFLAYDASKPKLRGSYKLPLAHVIDGRLKVPKGAIRAAASRLPDTDIPQNVKDEARSALDHYEEKAGMKDDKGGDRAISAAVTRAMTQPMTPVLKRGLYEVASLAYLLEQLGYAHTCAEWETSIEGDGSAVPGMLGDALVKLGAAFIAMSAEEAKELLSGKDMEIEDDDLIIVEERNYVAAGKTPRARAWRRGIAMARAGKKISADTQKKLEDGKGHLDRATKHSNALGEHHDAVGGHMDAITAAQEKANSTHAELGDAIQAAKSEPDKAAEHLTRAAKQHKALGGHLTDMSDEQATMHDRHLDVGDAHEAMNRSVRSAQRCMRSVSDESTVDDDDTKEVQTSAGAGESTGSDGSRSMDFRARQADLLRLSLIS